jgi:hypothetical protein
VKVRWWLRSVAVGFAVGFGVGLVIGGTVGRVFMRLLFLAKEDTLGLETAMGAIVGEFTGISVALTAAPVPLLVERLAPDRKRSPGRVAQSVVVLGMTGFAVFAVTGVVLAYTAV